MYKTAIHWDFYVSKSLDKIKVKGTIKDGKIENLITDELFLILLAKEFNGMLIPLVRKPRKIKKREEFCYFKLKFRSQLELFAFLKAVEKEFS